MDNNVNSHLRKCNFFLKKLENIIFKFQNINGVIYKLSQKKNYKVVPPN